MKLWLMFNGMSCIIYELMVLLIVSFYPLHISSVQRAKAEGPSSECGEWTVSDAAELKVGCQGQKSESAKKQLQRTPYWIYSKCQKLHPCH